LKKEITEEESRGIIEVDSSKPHQENEMKSKLDRKTVEGLLEKGLYNEQVADQCGVHPSTVSRFMKKHGLKVNGKKVAKVAPKRDEKSGIESRLDDRVIINWTTRTMITDLGEFGPFVCGFDMHGAIQRAYVDAYEGKGQTSSEVAMQFEFPHSKAVLLYARLHGFTKASPPQTDIEFEQGLTPEEASNETIQSLKRRTVKMTERKKWQRTQADADKWNHFDITVLKPTEDLIKGYLPKFKSPKVKPVTAKSPYAALVGVSDWHFMKQAYDREWNSTYDRAKAVKALQDANNSMIGSMLLQGTPDRIFLPVGTDNLHIDNPQQTTTKGTGQASATDGDWAGSLQQYIDVNLGMIEMYAQVAPVEVVVINGNHDMHTSEMLGVLLKTVYRDRKDITVHRSHYPRQYFRYGNTCIGIAHGDDISLSKLKGSLHKFIMVEAKEFGVDIHQCDEFVFFSGHLHFDSFEDLGGVKHFIIPSLSGTDGWHRKSGYIGSKKESALYIIDKKTGRKAIYYS